MSVEEGRGGVEDEAGGGARRMSPSVESVVLMVGVSIVGAVEIGGC